MIELTDANTCSDALAVEYFSFGIDHEGLICVVFKDEHGTIASHPLNVNDETDEGVLQLLCKLADVHPFDLGVTAANVWRYRDGNGDAL